MTPEDFERALNKVVAQLGEEVRTSKKYHEPAAFQRRCFEVLQGMIGKDLPLDLSFHPHQFPDIKAGAYGVEVKSVANDTWRVVGNSMLETKRAEGVERMYVIFGKMGGMAGVRWGMYEDRIVHVRISHAPRYEIDMSDGSKSLFATMGITYGAFCDLPAEKKMSHVRDYARGRLKPGERLWWLEDKPGQEKTLPLEVRLYIKLPAEEKKKLRAEVTLLFPEVVGHGRIREKYADVALYLITAHGILAHNARDMFSAGSVAGKDRGGIYTARAIAGLEPYMREAAASMSDALFAEYWERHVPANERIRAWLERADGYARDWKPSEVLFKDPGVA